MFLAGPCGRPADIPHAKFHGSSFDYKDKLRYSCKKGYKLSGPRKRTCRENGKWSRPPTCSRKASFNIIQTVSRKVNFRCRGVPDRVPALVAFPVS